MISLTLKSFWLMEAMLQRRVHHTTTIFAREYALNLQYTLSHMTADEHNQTSQGTRMDINYIPLIPRKLLFDNPERTQARLSPNGVYLSWLAPKDGVLNVW